MTALERARRDWLLRVETRLTELGGRKIRSSRTRREQTEQQSLSEGEGEGKWLEEERRKVSITGDDTTQEAHEARRTEANLASSLDRPPGSPGCQATRTPHPPRHAVIDLHPQAKFVILGGESPSEIPSVAPGPHSVPAVSGVTNMIISDRDRRHLRQHREQ